MEQRLEFVLRAIKHETSMTELCRNFGISRQTGYELMARYKADGLEGLKPHSRAPHRHPTAIAQEVCAAVIRAKARHPSWGPKKLQPLVDEAEAIRQQWPVASTRGAILGTGGTDDQAGTTARACAATHAAVRVGQCRQRHVVRRLQRPVSNGGWHAV
jgi:hypothetical protein